MLPSRLLIARQNFPDLRLGDVRGEARQKLEHSEFAARLRPGARVAIGVGSRGITDIATVVQSTVEYWRARGMLPFVFPAMGSHGAATPEGQAQVTPMPAGARYWARASEIPTTACLLAT